MCPQWCKIQVYLFCRSKTCSKQVSKGLKYTKWTTIWAQKSDIDHWICDVKIYLLGATRAPSWGQPLHQVWYWSSEGVKRYWADNTWSSDRQTDSCKTICPLFQGGHKNEYFKLSQNVFPWIIWNVCQNLLDLKSSACIPVHYINDTMRNIRTCS